MLGPFVAFKYSALVDRTDMERYLKIHGHHKGGVGLGATNNQCHH